MKALHYSNFIYMNNQELSEQAEIFVANVLQQYNWQTIAHRYRDIACELDLVCQKKKSLIIVEVKLRKKFYNDLSEMETLLPPSKLKALRRGIESFLNKRKIYYNDISLVLAHVKKSTQLKELRFYYYDNFF